MKANLTSLTLGTLMLINSAAVADKKAAAPSYEELRPTGTLGISSQLVRSGSLPVVSWGINYPIALMDIVDINPDDSLTPKTRTLMEVRVAGAAFQIGSNHTDVLLQAKTGGGSWNTVFRDNDQNVDANEIVLSKIVEAGERVDFSARASNGRGGWFSSRNTTDSNNTLIALADDAAVPNFTPAYQQATLNSFLSSYIVDTGHNNGHGNNLDGVDSSNPGNSDFFDASGPVDDEGRYRTTLGPRDVIYLFELYSNDIASSYYDMQDIVVVVTFKDVPED